eukprot:CAMPEP_0172453738 /NCGR_PEP_ID=MMETSP1065-20121228/10924_1 /TAXON_ID=265537 /ORGANISM="Amphiprora paludosa, Strain CCMP125" /LENGTH=463 /DNA_ID=CAMNT_0013205939 /DNA_START=65 /DNA_END=1456 /DNA_ORIENTATION=+
MPSLLSQWSHRFQQQSDNPKPKRRWRQRRAASCPDGMSCTTTNNKTNTPSKRGLFLNGLSSSLLIGGSNRSLQQQQSQSQPFNNTQGKKQYGRKYRHNRRGSTQSDQNRRMSFSFTSDTFVSGSQISQDMLLLRSQDFMGASLKSEHLEVTSETATALDRTETPLSSYTGSSSSGRLIRQVPLHWNLSSSLSSHDPLALPLGPQKVPVAPAPPSPRSNTSPKVQFATHATVHEAPLWETPLDPNELWYTVAERSRFSAMNHVLARHVQQMAADYKAQPTNDKLGKHCLFWLSTLERVYNALCALEEEDEEEEAQKPSKMAAAQDPHGSVLSSTKQRALQRVYRHIYQDSSSSDNHPNNSSNSNSSTIQLCPLGMEHCMVEWIQEDRFGRRLEQMELVQTLKDTLQTPYTERAHRYIETASRAISSRVATWMAHETALALAVAVQQDAAKEDDVEQRDTGLEEK